MLSKDSGTWISYTLIFYDVDVQAILQVPISLHGSEDRLIWKSILTGSFSVRSAYHLQNG